MKVRKKPVVVNAVQWFKRGDHHKVRAVPDGHSLWDAAGGSLAPKYGWIKTLEGGHIVIPGDWIVGPGAEGEYWPVKASIFKKTYELID